MSEQPPQPPTDDGYFVTVDEARSGPGTPTPALPAARPRALVWLLVVAVAASVIGVAWAVRELVDEPEVATEQVASPALTQPVAGGGSYAVWARNRDGTPVRWDPCEPIRWVMNLAGAPASAHADVLTALDRIAATTGLEFRFDGFVDERPTRDRAPFQPARYGEDRWAPVLVAWAAEGEPDVPLGTYDRAVAIPVAVGDDEQRAYVSGQMVFGTHVHLRPGFEDRYGGWGATILHELGHLVGLDHVDDQGELMFPYPGQGRGELGPGDLAGLAAVGADGGCLDTPRPRPVEVVYHGRSD